MGSPAPALPLAPCLPTPVSPRQRPYGRVVNAFICSEKTVPLQLPVLNLGVSYEDEEMKNKRKRLPLGHWENDSTESNQSCRQTDLSSGGTNPTSLSPEALQTQCMAWGLTQGLAMPMSPPRTSNRSHHPSPCCA